MGLEEEEEAMLSREICPRPGVGYHSAAVIANPGNSHLRKEGYGGAGVWALIRHGRKHVARSQALLTFSGVQMQGMNAGAQLPSKQKPVRALLGSSVFA